MQFWQHLLLGVALATVTFPANAISVDAADNDWTSTPLSSANITNAGEYYADSFTTSTNVNISGIANSSQAWTVSVRLTTLVNGLAIAVKRTGNGTGFPSGGDDTYYPLNNTAFQPLFTGSGNISGIPLEFQISNFDVTDGNGTKDIQIEYQVTTTP
ncbi:MAG: hypothetical protein BWK73_40095 [Thiothrix lacustris]|uniref:Spore coat protein U domain-containing protein n=1 Tax=Thiothrix lacustris TaxID=525917 RepID=A0A1Y1QDL6_9GAMM|nr:MAG: hypothetical protein BWK73_40095 [Thiothrix lacustris]